MRNDYYCSIQKELCSSFSPCVIAHIFFFFFHFAPRVGGNGIQHCLWLTKYPLEISASNSQNISHFEPWGELRKDSKLPKYIYYKVVKFFV